MYPIWIHIEIKGNIMKIALIGITGKIGQHIAEEVQKRGHEITAIVRRDVQLDGALAKVPVKVVDLADGNGLAEAVRGHDALASAYGPGAGNASSLLDVTKSLIAAARASGVKRVIVVGGAGSLEIAPGAQLVDAPTFPAIYKEVALAHREALGLLRNASDLEWTFYAPAAEIGPGEKRGQFRVGARSLISNAEGRSQISYPDYADAFVGEIENARFVRAIATVAY
jgi:putative NADH-flavin reductase